MAQSSTRNKILNALGIFGLVQVLTMICQVVRTKLTAIWTGAAGAGLIGLYNSTMEVIMNLAILNLRTSSVREISAESSEAEQARMSSALKYICLILGLAGTIFTALLSPLLSFWTFGDYTHTVMFILLAPNILMMGICMAEQAVMQSCGELKRLARANVCATVCALITSVPLLYFYRLQGIIPVLISYAIFNLIFSLIYRVRFTVDFKRPSLRESWNIGGKMIRLGLYMTLCYVADMFMSWLFAVYLNREYGIDTVGLYRSGFTLLSGYLGMVFVAIGMEYYPRLASVIHSWRATSVMVRYQSRFTSLLIVAPAMLMICLAPWVIRLLFSSAFESVTPFVAIGSIALPMRAVSWCMAYVMLVKGHGKMYTLTELMSTTINFVLNIVFFKAMGYAGLGWAYVIGMAAYVIIVWAVYRFRYNFRLGASTWLIVTGCTAIATLCYALTQV